MRRQSKFSVMILAMLCLGSAGFAQIADDTLQQVARYKFGDSREPLTTVEDLVRNALPQPEQCQALASQLSALLGTSATLEAKDFACRQLVLIGNADSVPALVALLGAPETADMARYALERISDPAADQALLDALGRAAGAVQAGIANSLGARRCAGAVTALAGLAASPGPCAGEAAIAALGQIGAPSAAALEQLKTPAPAERKRAISDAQLLCAEDFVAQQDFAAAETIYTSLLSESEAVSVRVAAFQGAVHARGESGLGLVLDAIRGDDAPLQASALRFVREWPGQHATKAFAGTLRGLSPSSQAQVITALGERGDSAARKAVLRMLRSKEEEVRIAVLNALAVLGDASSAGVLAKEAAATEGRSRAAASASLALLRGDGVDKAIVKGISKGNSGVRRALMQAAVDRKLAEAVPAVIDAAGSKNGEIRLAALRALGALGGEQDFAAAAALLAHASSDEEVAEAEKAAMAIGRKVTDLAAQAKVLNDAIAGATKPQVRAAFLRIIAALANNGALDAVRDGAKASDAGVRAAAIKALMDWPNPAVLEDLAAIVKNAENANARTEALAAYTRVLGLAADRPEEEVLERYAEALKTASSAEEKKAVLAGLGNYGVPGALALTTPLLGDSELKEAAIEATLKIARSISGAYRAEAEAAITAVRAATGDQSIQSEADRILTDAEKFGDFIVAWEVSGPYTQAEKDGSELYAIAFPPEEADARGVVWRVMPTNSNPDKPGEMNLRAVLGGDHRVAYLRTWLVSNRDQDALFSLGSNDGIRVWLNQEEVHGNNASRGCAPGSDNVTVKLKKGENQVLFKVNNTGGDWAACLQIFAPGGGPIEGVRAILH